MDCNRAAIDRKKLRRFNSARTETSAPPEGATNFTRYYTLDKAIDFV